MTDQHEFAGKTIEEALELAAGELAADPKSIEYKLLETPKRFFFMGGSKEYRIRVLKYTPAAGGAPVVKLPPPARSEKPARAGAAAPPARREEKRPERAAPPARREEKRPERAAPPVHREEKRPERAAPPVHREEDRTGSSDDDERDDDELDRIMDLVEDFIDAWDMNLEMDVDVSDERLEINFFGDDERYLLEKKGAGLLALQLILGKMLYKRGLIRRKLQVDCQGYRQRRENELREIAGRTADRVKKNGEAAILNPMNPYERRIVHLALVDDDQVTTDSLGEGYMKKIRVTRI